MLPYVLSIFGTVFCAAAILVKGKRMQLILLLVTACKNEENLKSTEADANIILGNMAIFKDEKLLGYLTKEQSIAVNILKNEVNSQ